MFGGFVLSVCIGIYRVLPAARRLSARLRGGRGEAVLCDRGAEEAVALPLRAPQGICGACGHCRRDDVTLVVLVDGRDSRAGRHRRVRAHADALVMRPALARDVVGRRARRRALAAVEELAGLSDLTDLHRPTAGLGCTRCNGHALCLGLPLVGSHGRELTGLSHLAVAAILCRLAVLDLDHVVCDNGPPRLAALNAAEVVCRLEPEEALRVGIRVNRRRAAEADAVGLVLQKVARAVAPLERPLGAEIVEVLGREGGHEALVVVVEHLGNCLDCVD